MKSCCSRNIYFFHFVMWPSSDRIRHFLVLFTIRIKCIYIITCVKYWNCIDFTMVCILLGRGQFAFVGELVYTWNNNFDMTVHLLRSASETRIYELCVCPYVSSFDDDKYRLTATSCCTSSAMHKLPKRPSLVKRCQMLMAHARR